jgi:hypothetical protein
MALPQYNGWGVNGEALNTQGLCADDNFDEVSLLMFGLIFPTAAIWNACSVITDTVWAACAVTATTWTDSPVITSTVWTDS